jgi:hypothetical protein
MFLGSPGIKEDGVWEGKLEQNFGGSLAKPASQGFRKDA